MGNLRMKADQISYKGGNTPMTVEEVLKNSSGESAAIEQLQQDVSDLNSNKANKGDIATEFSNLTNYNAGDLVYYDGALYEYQVDHTAGAWESSEVIQKDLSDIVTTLKSGLIKHTTETVSGTSNSSGVLISAYGVNTKIVMCYMEEYMAIPYINGGVWKFVICDSSSTSGIVQIKNTAVSVNVVIETVG